MASMRLNFYGVGVERLETCTQGHNKGGRAEGIMKPETLGCEGFKVLSAWLLVGTFLNFFRQSEHFSISVFDKVVVLACNKIPADRFDRLILHMDSHFRYGDAVAVVIAHGGVELQFAVKKYLDVDSTNMLHQIRDHGDSES